MWSFRDRNILASLCVLALTSVVVAPVAAQVGLEEILSKANATLQWDISLGFGSIRRGANQVAFKPGSDWVLVNNNERITTGEITRANDGAIHFTTGGALAVEAALKRAPPALSVASTGARPRIAAIIIDPGHGGQDPGTSHSHVVNGKQLNLVEKNIVLTVAQQVYANLAAKYPDKRILLTRSADTYVSLEQRTELANSIHLKENEAMIFVSIHANASFDPKADGFEVWYLPPNYRRDVIDPTTLDSGSKELYPILNSMREEEYTIESVLLGRKILSGVSTAVGAKVPDRGLKAESWFVVRNAKMPAVLIELGFVTNQTEAALLSTPSYLQKLARGIYNGITGFVNYFDDLSGFME
ncbi:MAG TPA: N-acetylmuramoyl-L-alanine amidase [Spirochaetia bacterium]|nr:N-acetylmuramoyl-L-alanine amidase [Spirochaetia bacterium]